MFLWVTVQSIYSNKRPNPTVYGYVLSTLSLTSIGSYCEHTPFEKGDEHMN